jgi:hypothetical protein
MVQAGEAEETDVYFGSRVEGWRRPSAEHRRRAPCFREASACGGASPSHALAR